MKHLSSNLFHLIGSRMEFESFQVRYELSAIWSNNCFKLIIEIEAVYTIASKTIF